MEYARVAAVRDELQPPAKDADADADADAAAAALANAEAVAPSTPMRSWGHGDVQRWLRAEGLAQYETPFAPFNGADVADLSDYDLSELGVAATAHRRKICALITAANPKTEAEVLATLPPIVVVDESAAVAAESGGGDDSGEDMAAALAEVLTLREAEAAATAVATA